MNPTVGLLIIAQAAVSDATTLSPGALAALSIGLLMLALALVVLEIFIISGGLLSALAALCAIIAIVFGFRVDPIMGWTLLVIAPIAFIGLVRWGIQRLQRSPLVTQATISGNAGYDQVADSLDIHPDAVGTLTTDAYPTGRARFKGGEVDVSLESGSGKRGDGVLITRIDGPEIWVVCHQQGEAE